MSSDESMLPGENGSYEGTLDCQLCCRCSGVIVRRLSGSRCIARGRVQRLGFLVSLALGPLAVVNQSSFISKHRLAVERLITKTVRIYREVVTIPIPACQGRLHIESCRDILPPAWDRCSVHQLSFCIHVSPGPRVWLYLILKLGKRSNQVECSVCCESCAVCLLATRPVLPSSRTQCGRPAKTSQEIHQNSYLNVTTSIWPLQWLYNSAWNCPPS